MHHDGVVNAFSNSYRKVAGPIPTPNGGYPFRPLKVPRHQASIQKIPNLSTRPTMTSSSPIMSVPGTLHRYTKRLVAFEHANASSNLVSTTQNILLWVGGLGDGLLTVSYPRTLAQSLPPTWSLVEVMLSSSYNGFGTSSLSKDAKELGQCVEYFRSLGPNAKERKVVIMGHSTGSQDCMEYAVGEGSAGRPRVNGLVLQGSVSDREALRESMGEEEYGRIVELVREHVSLGRGDDIIPAFREGIKVYGRTPVTAYRWNSFLSAEGPGVGDDDYFSSDLSDERLRETFGKLGVPLMVLFSGEDEHCPKFIHKEALIERWGRVVKGSGGIVDDDNGGIVRGATHNLEGNCEEVIRDLCRRVCGFLGKVEREDFTSGAPHL